MNYGKLSLTLSILVREYIEYILTRVPMKRDLPRPQALSIFEDKLEVKVFIHCDEDADFGGLAGVRMHSHKKTRVRTATVDFHNPLIVVDGLGKLMEHTKVHYISSSMQLTPLNDIAAVKTGLTNFRISHGALTGKGVVIGIIDSGIDSLHPAFDDHIHSSRIHSIWDQTIPGDGLNGEPSYGQVLTDTDMAGSLDEFGHGTQIAGIAAGSHPLFGGVAHEATIVVVKTDFQTAHIADGIRYVFTIADELGKPAVVNLSAGGQLDSHDGMDDLSKFIAQELDGTTGKIVVAAAGNDGTNKTHARVVLPPREKNKPKPSRISHFEIPDGTAIRQLVLRAWYRSDGQGLIRLINPSGTAVANTRLKANRREFAPANILAVNHVPYSDGKSEAFTAETLVPCVLNNSHELMIDTRRDPNLETGPWRLEIENDSDVELTVDIWLWAPESAKSPEFARGINSPERKIGSPGCSEDAITVASYTTRGDGLLFEKDVISQFSSPGPLRNDKLKPDVAAPGALIISARSNKTEALVTRAIGSGFTTGSGTSMSAAFVTGVCALLLQNNPTLTPAAIKAWLRTHSQIPVEPAVQHHEKWGYGKLDLTDVSDLP